MSEKSIIIIGAGLGGLSTGCYAQMNGYQTHIFEQHRVSGGLACCWKRKGYLIDGGIHFLTGYRPGYRIYNIFKEIGVDKIPYVNLTMYGRFTDEKQGISVDVHDNLANLQQELVEKFPEDHRTIRELISATKIMARKDLQDIGFTKPGELMGVTDWIKELWKLKGSWRFMIGKWNKPVYKYVEKVHDPFLKELLMNLFLPIMPAWFIVMILGSLVAGQLGVIQEGSLEFARAIEKRYLELGGEISYQSDVKEILVEDNCATGVLLADESKHRSDYVVSAADGYHTIFELLKGRYVNEKIKKRYLEAKGLYSMVEVSFGVSQEFKDEPWMTLMKLEQPITIGSESIDLITFRVLNYGSNFAPKGKTVFQVGFEGDWNFWNELRKDKENYDAEKERIAADVLKILDRHYPGFSSKVEVTDVATPWTYYRYTRNFKGSIMGFIPDNFYEQVKKTLPGLSNFFMAGQWSMPLGGVLTTIYSGRHVMQLICRKDNKKFKTVFA
ncbi:MAG: phytoene desaturase family protein [Candidatus Hermodarchaeota archaeon]